MIGSAPVPARMASAMSLYQRARASPFSTGFGPPSEEYHSASIIPRPAPTWLTAAASSDPWAAAVVELFGLANQYTAGRASPEPRVPATLASKVLSRRPLMPARGITPTTPLAAVF